MKFDPSIVYAILGWLILIGLSGSRIRHYQYHLRGNRLTPILWVGLKLLRWRIAPDALAWGRRRLPAAIACQNFLVAGTVGSGKTVIVRLLLQNEMQKYDGSRYLIYDGKGDLLDIVCGMKRPQQRVITFDPFLAEGARWAIWKDVVDAASCNQVARILFPKADHEHQPFFPESVQNLAAAVMLTFILSGIQGWRLSHLLFILRSADRIQQVLRLTERGRDILAVFTQTGETWANIMATMANRINDYEIVAALWDHAGEEYSLREWAKEDAILILRKSPQCSEVVDCMNRVLFAMAKRYLLSKPASTRERSWVVLDELASFGGRAVNKELALLLEQGRSRNIACILGFQNISSLRDELGVYGADRLVALCSTKALLRFEDHASAEWAAGFFGQQEVRVISTPPTQGQNISSTTSYDNKERAVVMPSEFQAIPRAGRKHGLAGYFTAPVGDPPLAYRDRIPGRWLFNGKTLASAETVERTMRPDEQQQLSVTQQDIERLFGGQPGATPPAATNGASASEGSASEPQAAPRPAHPQSAPQPAQSPAAARPTQQALRAPTSQQPEEVWNLSEGTVTPAPSIWNVPRQ
jgi:hypothetical protein